MLLVQRRTATSRGELLLLHLLPLGANSLTSIRLFQARLLFKRLQLMSVTLS